MLYVCMYRVFCVSVHFLGSTNSRHGGALESGGEPRPLAIEPNPRSGLFRVARTGRRLLEALGQADFCWCSGGKGKEEH